MRFRFVMVLAVVLVVAGSATSAAFADTPVIPNDGSLPWSDPNHSTPLEQVLSRIASTIAQRQVHVHCNGDTEWSQLASNYALNPAAEAGFVPHPLQWYPLSRTWYDSSDIEFLSPTTCTYLVQFARAASKPTKCPTTTTQTVLQTVRYRATIRAKVEKRVRINGHWVMRPVWVTRTVWKTKQAPVQTTVAGPPAPCYPSGDVSGDYGNYAYAIWVLAHESIHLYDMRSGGSVDLPFEIRADCYGLQWVRYAAQQLGDTADDGEAIAQYDFNVQYPTHQGITNGGGQPYWSADCHQGGPLDLSPSDGVWP